MGASRAESPSHLEAGGPLRLCSHQPTGRIEAPSPFHPIKPLVVPADEEQPEDIERHREQARKND